MPGSINRGAVRWLRGQLPELVASGVITSESARAIELHYESTDRRSSLGFILLAIVGSALIGAGIILLIAHNWDQLNRATRSVIAFLPLITAQILCLFVLARRNESQAWREGVAIFDVAAVGTAIALISQTYQIQGSFADFMLVWLLLSIPVVYLLRTSVGAVAYLIGTVAWVFSNSSWSMRYANPNLFWFLWLLVVPYFLGCLRRDRTSRETAILSICLLLSATIALGFTADATQANIGAIAFAGLFAATYLAGMKLIDPIARRLHPVALVAGLGIGVTAIILSFEDTWHMSSGSSAAVNGTTRVIGIAIELSFPAVALLVLGWDLLRRNRIVFSMAAAIMPLVAGGAWIIANLAPAAERGGDSSYSFTASLVFDVYALVLGIELLSRGVRANSLARANFGLLVIAALAIARFFDSDLGFATRGLGFIVVGAAFLIANVIFFRRRAAQ